MRPELERQANEGDAASYWKQFPVTAHWDEPRQIVGTVLELTEVRKPEGKYPRLVLQQADGLVIIVNVAQARLLAALVEAAPVVGDKVRITYRGEATHPDGRPVKAQGMSPTKQFSVEVKRMAPPADTKAAEG